MLLRAEAVKTYLTDLVDNSLSKFDKGVWAALVKNSNGSDMEL